MNQLTLVTEDGNELVNIRDASIWASQYLNRKITTSNISYLLQYGRIKKYGKNGNPLLSKQELKKYYDSFLSKEKQWKKKYGGDLNWHLSFVEYKESERTKHVHRLHPYKGKFIPQLVEYFIDSHTDEFKKEVYFHKGDIILDPFCGSGTTLIQANELGMHAIGIDISVFNAMITNTKLERHDLPLLKEQIKEITSNLSNFYKSRNYSFFENRLISELAKFNSRFFPSPEYKRGVRRGEIHENDYASEKEKIFLEIYDAIIKEFCIKIEQDKNDTFLDKWFLFPVREEIDFLLSELHLIKNEEIRRDLSVILSRTIRSCRATTHADLGTLKEPVYKTYYCKKHGKICKPLFSSIGWWRTYSIDTINRIKEFEKLRTNTQQFCLTGDSRSIDIYEEIKCNNVNLAEMLSKQKIRGIFSSPPYVGLIDYHEQHAYAYELFNLERKDKLEIGPLFKGQGRSARDSYSEGIADVLRNCKKFLQNDYDIFLVVNDKFNLYPKIAEIASMRIINRYKRPVLNRVEKDRNSAYAETIFHLREK